MGMLREAVPTIVLAAVMAAALTACSGGNKRLSKTDVQLVAGDLRTHASSTQMLIEQCSAGHATETFCREQADLLSSKVDDAISQLNGEAGPVESERAQLSDTAAKLRAIVLRIESSTITGDDAQDAGR